MTVLVVEDHVDTARAVRKLLQYAGHRAEVAHSCSAARELCKYFRPDVLLCDIVLPDGSGVELAREVMALRPETCAIAITGSAQEQESLLSLGFRAALMKPVDFGQLQKVIREVCLPTEGETAPK